MSKFDRDLRRYFQPIDFSADVTYDGSGSMDYTSVTTSFYWYIHIGNVCWISMDTTAGTTAGTASNALQATLPVAPASNNQRLAASYRDATSGSMRAGQAFTETSGNIVSVYKEDASNFALAAGRRMAVSGWYYTSEIG